MPWVWSQSASRGLRPPKFRPVSLERGPVFLSPCCRGRLVLTPAIKRVPLPGLSYLRGVKRTVARTLLLASARLCRRGFALLRRESLGNEMALAGFVADRTSDSVMYITFVDLRSDEITR